MDNILAVKAAGEFTEDTNISAVVEGGKFYTFNLRYVPFLERFSFVIDKEKTQKVAILDEKERSSEQKERIREAITGRPALELGLRTGMRAWSSRSGTYSSTGTYCLCA